MRQQSTYGTFEAVNSDDGSDAVVGIGTEYFERAALKGSDREEDKCNGQVKS